MSTVAVEPEVDLASIVAQPDQTVLYMSRRSELRLTIKSRHTIRDPHTGQNTGEKTRGIFVGFRDGVARIPREGKIRLVDTLDGGESDPLDAEWVIGQLEAHRLNGSLNEGFWRVDPTAPPISPAESQLIVDAATAWDVQGLEAFIATERAGWNRTEIIEVAEGAILRIHEAEDRIRADQDARRAQEQAAVDAQDKRLSDAEARAKAAEDALAAALAESKAEPKPKAK